MKKLEVKIYIQDQHVHTAIINIESSDVKDLEDDADDENQRQETALAYIYDWVNEHHSWDWRLID